MELRQKIKQLRFRASMTQERLAEELGVSAQAVSKWETAVCMPDISLLPALAGCFGVSIDELFNLTAEQRLQRIERRMDVDAELPGDLFLEYEEYLRQQMDEHKDKQRVLSMIAHLYHHRMESDAKKISRYAREAIRLAPEKKDCQWLLDMAEGSAAWDWNVCNHSRVIDFYKEVIRSDKIEPHSPLPYYYLLDNLIADRRTKEAQEYLQAFVRLPAHRPFMAKSYEAHIALAEFDEAKGDAIMRELIESAPQDPNILFEAAQYYAKKADYDKALDYYEASYAAEADKKPRFCDALQGIARIYELQGQYEKAAATCDRILESFKDEWGFTEEFVIAEAEADKKRLLDKAAQKS